MRVSWVVKDTILKEGDFPPVIEAPGTVNLSQGTTYRLKLTNIRRQPGLEVYPTLEVVKATNPRVAELLAHCPVPLGFSDDDFKQVRAGNAIVKVIYLPLEASEQAGYVLPAELRSMDLASQAHLISEASRKGDVLLVIRLGSMEP
jgi:hypothetical protein